MYERNKSIASQTVFEDVSKWISKFFFVKSEKIDKLCLNYYRYIVQAMVCVFWGINTNSNIN